MLFATYGKIKLRNSVIKNPVDPVSIFPENLYQKKGDSPANKVRQTQSGSHTVVLFLPFVFFYFLKKMDQNSS